MSPKIQNELLGVMGRLALQNISTDLQQSPYLTFMLDETTNVSNHEQAVIVLRRVMINELKVFEEFLGLYYVLSIDSNTLTKVVKMFFAALICQCLNSVDSAMMVFQP